jgi:choline dehydrogenase-like flavoprotein
MHIDLDEYRGASRVAAEICIVGGGAAGITAARHLVRLGHAVTLLESGGIDYEPAIARLNAGENIGATYYNLEDARLRFFGGTTAIWGGRVAQLDPIDLEVRPWVPHSGWPIQWNELAAYYTPARRVFGLPDTGATSTDLAESGTSLPGFDPTRLEIGIWDFDRRFNRFQFHSCRDLTADPRCTLYTHATVTELNLHPGGHFVESLTVRSLSGRALTLTASVVLLAGGGLEIPRLLLASRSVAPRGVGNDYDQVGRYFMEHPHARGGSVTGKHAWALLNAFGRPHRVKGRDVAALIKPSAQLQRQRDLLNTSLTITARQAAGASQAWGMRAYSRIKHGVAPTNSGRSLWMTTKKAATWLQKRTDPMRPWLLHKLGLRDIALLIRAEQAPNPASRVVLTSQCDALGMPRIALDWRLTQQDIDSVTGLVRAVDEELQRLGLGAVCPARWLSDGTEWQVDPLISAHPIGGYHHMGTTRMTDNPRNGVTDRHGRVLGVENLYVVGSSVFPTSGWANPTLTVIALTLRTSDYISQRLARAIAV